MIEGIIEYFTKRTRVSVLSGGAVNGAAPAAHPGLKKVGPGANKAAFHFTSS